MRPPHKRIWLVSVWVTLFTFQVFPATAQNRGEKVKPDNKKNPSDATIFTSDTFIHRLLAGSSHYFSEILKKKEELGIQVIYTRIDRTKKNQYFYPSSTVKLPVAILALQKLNELNIPGLDKNSTMYTASAGERLSAVANDPSAPDGRPTIAHYIKKILLVSDNDAFNRLYEFLGQEYINNSLHKMGYVHTKIIHRLSISLSEEENRLANAVTFIDSNGKILYYKPAERSNYPYKTTTIKMGKGFIRGNELVNEPFDFSYKNAMPLQDLHQIVKSILFPEAMPKEKRFNLTAADYIFLRRYMSMLPAESD